MDHTKKYQVVMDSPCRELSLRDLGFVVCSLFGSLEN